MGGGQPFGFSLGLVMGGIFVEFLTWRAGFYVGAAIIAFNFALIFWGLPSSVSSDGGRLNWQQRREQIRKDIDWVGAVIASTSLAMLSYVFATITGEVSNIKEPSSIALLSLAVALVPCFIFWVGRQERLGRPAIIPNSLWRNRVFTTVCLCVLFAWSAFNALETLLTFYFQDVQGIGPLQTSLRFLPAAGAGITANVVAGYLVPRVAANLIVDAGLIIAAASPLVMTFAKPDSTYLSSGFIANILNPCGVDALFTVANLLITSSFPAKTQGLAGGVFNTISQIGKAIGLALVAVIASSVTARSHYTDKKSPDALLVGYKAAYWFCFGLGVTAILVALWGLRRIGNVGHKRD